MVSRATTAPMATWTSRLFYSKDEYGFVYSMSSNMATYSVLVMSPMSEPAPLGFLAVGLITLRMRRHFKD